MDNGILTVLEYIGIITFAISGAFVGIQKRLDWFGIYLVATATAVGGGILRDTVMNIGVPVIFRSYMTFVLILVACILAILLRNYPKWNDVILVCDAIGLGVFAIDAGVKSIEMGFGITEFLFMAVVTGVGGGILRDILCQRVPIILRKEIYAIAALVGALVLWFVYPLWGQLGSYLSIGVVVAVRLVSVYFHINLPVVQKQRQR